MPEADAEGDTPWAVGPLAKIECTRLNIAFAFLYLHFRQTAHFHKLTAHFFPFEPFRENGEPFGPRPAAHSIFKNPREIDAYGGECGGAGAYSRPCTKPNRATEYKATARARSARVSRSVC